MASALGANRRRKRATHFHERLSTGDVRDDLDPRDQNGR
jgi:hypothetical protein